jgi:hypothetical protein
MFFDVFTSSFYDRIITGYFNIFYLVMPVLAPYFICYFFGDFRREFAR